jgi:hypothetical protein
MSRLPPHRVDRRLIVPAAVAAVTLAFPTAAAATTHARGGSSLFLAPALLGIGIPSISDILRSIANDLFNVLAGAFLPGWLKHAPAATLRWLIALPDPADAVQWPTMHRLEQDTTAVAVAFLPLTLAVAAARYTASSVAGGVHHPAESLGRLVGAAFGLVIFPWAFSNMIAAVNVTTTGLLSFADIDHGLQRALALMFTGGLLFGVTGPLIAVLVIGAIMLAAGLFVMKVGILALFAILFVAGPLTLACYPIPELHGAFRLWSGLLIALAAIPIGWCVIFATAGAISADITHIGTPVAIGTRLVGFFAGVLTFWIAFRWPFFLITMVRNRGLLSTDLGGGANRQAAAGGVSLGERAAQARTALLATGGTVGGAVSAAGTAVGVPRGGLAGAGARLAARGARWAAGTGPTVQYRAGTAAAWDGLRARAAGSRPGRTRLGKAAAAGGSILATAPAAVRASVANRRAPDGGREAGEAVLAAAAARASGGRNAAGAAPLTGRGRASATPPDSAAPSGTGLRPPAAQTTPAPGRSAASSRAAVDTAAAVGAAAAAAAAQSAETQSSPLTAPRTARPPSAPTGPSSPPAREAEPPPRPAAKPPAGKAPPPSPAANPPADQAPPPSPRQSDKPGRGLS